MKKILISLLAGFAVAALLIFTSSGSAQIVAAGTDSGNASLFDTINTTILVNNSAQFDLYTYVECSYIDPEENPVDIRSQCNLVYTKTKKEFQTKLVLNKPGEWKLHSCIAYASLQEECKDAEAKSEMGY